MTKRTTQYICQNCGATFAIFIKGLVILLMSCITLLIGGIALALLGEYADWFGIILLFCLLLIVFIIKDINPSIYKLIQQVAKCLFCIFLGCLYLGGYLYASEVGRGFLILTILASFFIFEKYFPWKIVFFILWASNTRGIIGTGSRQCWKGEDYPEWHNRQLIGPLCVLLLYHPLSLINKWVYQQPENIKDGITILLPIIYGMIYLCVRYKRKARKS